MVSKKGMGFADILIIAIFTVLVAASISAFMVRNSHDIVQEVYDVTGDTEARSNKVINTFYAHGYTPDFEQITHWYLKTKIAAGGERILLNATIVKFSARNDTINLMHNESINCSNRSTFNPSQYGTEYLMTGYNYKPGYFMEDDVVMICFESLMPVYPRDDVMIMIIPMQGEPTFVESRLPFIFDYQEMQIFP